MGSPPSSMGESAALTADLSPAVCVDGVGIEAPLASDPDRLNLTLMNDLLDGALADVEPIGNILYVPERIRSCFFRVVLPVDKCGQRLFGRCGQIGFVGDDLDEFVRGCIVKVGLHGFEDLELARQGHPPRRPGIFDQKRGGRFRIHSQPTVASPPV